ncbi:MAG: hypothetical protein M3542_09640, partial [Acidobacteriota bacterium]|nr:hypothetical protein [Acidobacteriota bacterium]
MVTRVWLVALFSLTSAVFAGAAPFPLAFEANEGQWPPEVRFVARGRSGLVVLNEDGAVFAHTSQSGEN